METKNYWCPFKNEKCNETCKLYNANLKDCRFVGMAINLYEIRKNIESILKGSEGIADQLLTAVFKGFEQASKTEDIKR